MTAKDPKGKSRPEKYSKLMTKAIGHYFACLVPQPKVVSEITILFQKAVYTERTLARKEQDENRESM
ncbi:MAG: hypothetical protein PHC51_10955 [bacterium]|nr:hypothetical protein [bacterium]